MIVLPACRELVGLRCKALLLGWTRFFERNGLKVTSRYGLGVVPTYLERAVAHRVGSCRTLEDINGIVLVVAANVAWGVGWSRTGAHAGEGGLPVQRVSRSRLGLIERSLTPFLCSPGNPSTNYNGYNYKPGTLYSKRVYQADPLIAKHLHAASTSNYSTEKAKQRTSCPHSCGHLPVLRWFP